ncbi:hypothetical protein D3C78_1689970 [compost metagenome]
MVIAFTKDGFGLLGAPACDVLGIAAINPGKYNVDVEIDVTGVVGEHVLDCGPSQTMPLHGSADGVLPEHGPARQ